MNTKLMTFIAILTIDYIITATQVLGLPEVMVRLLALIGGTVIICHTIDLFRNNR